MAERDMRAMERNSNAAPGMTKEDILCRLADHDLMDEMLVAEKYLDYASALEANGCPELAETFIQMAHEEFTHAHVQRDILLKHGYSLTEAGEEKFKDLKERFRHM